jgi:hypothetical protein
MRKEEVKAMKIGHASISEKGTVNGVAGDSTGKEVCIRDFYVYKGGWDAVLIPVTDEIAEQSAQACEKGCANSKIGYGQNTRNTAHKEAAYVGYQLDKINVPCNTDCSAYMTLCAIAGGVKELEYNGNAPTTSTMINKFIATGKYKVSYDKKFLSSPDYLKRGYILVKKGHHTVMCLENGAKSGAGKNTYTIAKPTLHIKMFKAEVGILQSNLNKALKINLDVDNDFGQNTYNALCEFQKRFMGQKEVDGIYGPKTAAKMSDVLNK